MELNEKIGARVKQLRTKRGLTGEQLGEYLKVTKTQVSYIEKGKSRLNTDQLSTLTSLFGVTASYLMCEVDKNESIVDQLRKENKELETVVNYFQRRDDNHRDSGNQGKSNQHSSTAPGTEKRRDWERSGTGSDAVSFHLQEAS